MNDLMNPFILKSKLEEEIMERAEGKTLLFEENRICPRCGAWIDEWTGMCECSDGDEDQ